MLKWVKSFRAMSSLRKGAPPPRMKKKTSDPIITNGNSNTTSLYYPNDPPDDENMNEIADENIDLTVLLPEGKVKDTSVNSNIPMMDLLVNLAARNKLSPAGYTIVVLNEETRKPVEYKPNQTVGSLCPKTVDGTPRHLTFQLAPKKTDSDKQRNTKIAQPFEMTYRFTVNLPQNQKKVLRISQTTPLEDVHRQICSEKNLDPFRYIFQLPSDPYTKLNMQMTVGELKSNEINLTTAGTVNSAMSMPNLSADRSQSTKTDVPYMPTMGEPKKKKGFFSFLKKDNSKKFNLQSVQRDAFIEQPISARERAPVRSTSQENSQPQRRSNENPGARPKTMYAVSTSNLDQISDSKGIVPPLDLSGLNNSQNASSKSKSLTALKTVNENDKNVVAPPRKKRRAPPPPQAQAQSVQNTVQVEISVEKTNLEKKVAKSKVESSEIRQRTENVSKFHSRNSSDSSGYHELTLSGAESPDGPRIDENFEVNVNIETASVDSGGHLNGDSGIRDISPPSSRRKEVDDNVGSSQTLPLERSKKKGAASSTPRSNSLDRAGKKKKAPPPPPGSPPKPPVPSVTSTAPAPKKKDEDNIAINAVLDSLDQNLEDHDTSGSGMMMVENSSIHSEDIDADYNQSVISHPPRPCAFVAPPPPSEPPPDDSEPVDYNMIMNGRVDTVDVGVETSDDSTSYGPVSTRSSTESPVSKNSYKTEMAQFVENMKGMTVDGQLNKSQLDGKDFKIDSAAQNNDVDDAVYIFSNDGDDSVEMENVPETHNESEKSRDQQNTNHQENINDLNREVSEITYDFKVASVPPEFQSEMEAPDEVEFVKVQEEAATVQQEVEEEEEEVFTETIEIIYPFSEPLVEPEIETKYVQSVQNIPQEEIAIVKNNEHEKEMISVDSKPVAKVVIEEKVILGEPEKNTVREPEKVKAREPEKIIPKEPEKPKQKEEFVLTFDDLSNVDFSLMRKKKKIQPKPKPTYQSTPEKRHTVSTLDELKSNFVINNENVFITPCKEHNIEMDDGSILTEGGSVRGHKGEVKTKCSELSFSPSSEGEMENVLEEKSISMINLPATRNHLDVSMATEDDNVKDDIIVSRTEIVFSVKSTSNKTEENTQSRKVSTNSNLEKSVNDSGVEAEAEVDVIDHQEVLSAQYKQLQQQFLLWKTQLEENKKLLSSSQAISADDTSRQFQQQLQSQIQLQQQMLQQMQQSMEALSLQQQQQKSMEDQTKQKQTISENQSSQNEEQSSEKVLITENHVEQKQSEIVQSAIPPPPPMIPNGKVVSSTGSNEQIKPKSRNKSRKLIEPKLDPREELMIAIKNFGGRSAMKKVPVNKTHWHSGIP